MDKPTKLSEEEQIERLRELIQQQPRMNKLVESTRASYMLEDLHRDLEMFWRRCNAAKDAELERLRAENATLRVALEPFANEGRGIPDNWPGQCSLSWIEATPGKRRFVHNYEREGDKAGPTIAKYRRAAKALEASH